MAKEEKTLSEQDKQRIEQPEKIGDCYKLADIILKPFRKHNYKGETDPLAETCLAELLYRFKYDKTFKL